MAMKVGDVRIAEDSDFKALRDMCTCHEGWKKDYSKNNTTVWTRANDLSDFKQIKIYSKFIDVSASTLFDVLHDPEYRKVWDTNMLESYEICFLNPNNDIGYYSLKTPKPMKARDFVLLRSWLETHNEYYIMNHSINHADHPIRKNVIRGISYITGYFILPLGSSKCAAGCQIFYTTQSDPKGKLPSWIVNKVTQIFAPKVMGRLHKAAAGYIPWKQKHNPNLKPWLYPEQISIPRLEMSQIGSMAELQSAPQMDESSLQENDFTEDDV